MRLIDHVDKLHALVEKYATYYRESAAEKGEDSYPLDGRDAEVWLDDFIAWLEFSGEY